MPSSLTRRAIRGALSLSCLASAAWGQQSAELPFAPGERMTYAGRVHVGVAGSGTISVDAPTQFHGTTTWVLRSDMQGKLGPIKATERHASWLDPVRMAALRYTSSERHLFRRHSDAVNISPEERRWASDGGLSGELATDRPLDELSFLFYLRTLPLPNDSVLTVSRHFDVARNPTTLRVLGREEIDVGAGRFHAIIVEMRVRDTRRYQGEGTIRIHLSDDRCRLLLRLESKLPDAGAATLALVSYSGTRWTCSARVDTPAPAQAVR
jgi:hypothetical protein